jgi:predicted transcriptional regulator
MAGYELDFQRRLDLCELSLEELTELANIEHEATIGLLKDSLVHAIGVGDILNEIHTRIPWGEWVGWLEENFSGSHGTAALYRRIAWYATDVQESGTSTIADAIAYLQLHNLNVPRMGNREATTVKEARKLMEKGLSGRAAARELGISNNKLRWWMGLGKKSASSSKKEYLRKKREEKKVKQQIERDELARQRGGSVAEVYSLIRKAAQQLDAASLLPGQSAEAKGSLTAAIRLLYKVEDHVVEALRQS